MISARCILALLKLGAVAAHPADGWFNRHAPNRIYLANPYFCKGRLKPGDIIAIGWANNWQDEPSAGIFSLYRIVDYKPWVLRLNDDHGDYILEQITGEFCIIKGSV